MQKKWVLKFADKFINLINSQITNTSLIKKYTNTSYHLIIPIPKYQNIITKTLQTHSNQSYNKTNKTTKKKNSKKNINTKQHHINLLHT